MEEKLHLSQDEVWSVVEFADNLYSYGKYGYYNPHLSNSLMNSLNNNAVIPTYDLIIEALKGYKENGDNLQAYGEFMEKFDAIYSRTVEYYANLLSFDLKISCKNAKGADYRSKEYLEDKNRVYKFLDNFNYKAEFRKAVKEVLRHETYFCWLRDNMDKTNTKYALQMMPQSYCLMDGYWEMGILYSFNMQYFMIGAGVDINEYAPIMKTYMNELFTDGQMYNPSAQLNARDGSFAMWHQTSPEYGAWCFKLNTENFNTTPFLSPLLKSSIRNEEVASLQYDKDFLSAYALLYGEMGMMNDAKSGSKPDQFAVNPKTLGQFMSLVSKGLSNKIKSIAMPLEEVEFKQFSDSNAGMYSNQLKTSAAQGASASRLIYSTDKMSNEELFAAVMTDYGVVRKMYEQFNNFLNYYVNKKTRKYKFNFEFIGSTMPFEREKRQKAVLELAERGLVLNSSAFASAYGYAPQEFDRMLDEAHNGEMLDNLSMLLSIHTGGAGATEGGRPPKDAGDLSDSGAASRDS